MDRKVFLWLIVILLLALAVRLWGINHRIWTDEVKLVPASMKLVEGGAWPLSAYPTTYYPHAYLYVLGVAFWPIQLFFPGAGAEVYYVMARIVTVVFSVATVGLVFLIGRRMAGQATGLAAAAIAAFIPLGVKYAHYAQVDVPTTFFMAAALWAALHVWDEGTAKWYILAGILTGAAGATQYWGFSIGAALLLAHGARVWHEGVALRLIFKPVFLLSLILIPTTFFFISSGSILDAESRTAFRNIQARGQAGDLGYIRPNVLWPLYNRSPDWSMSFTSAGLLWEAGVVTMGLAAIGCFFAWKEKRWRVLILCGILGLTIYLAISGGMKMYAIKRLLPLIPLLALLAGYSIDRLRQRAPTAAIVGLVLALSISAWDVMSFDAAYAGGSTQTVAREWFEMNMPHGATVLQHTPVELINHEDSRWRLLRMDQVYANFNAEDPEAAHDRSKSLHEWMSEHGVEFIVLDSRMVDRYYDSTTEKLFPETTASYQMFFHDIREHGKQVFGVWPERWKIAGPWIEIYDVRSR